MTDETFIALVKRLEGEATRSPRWYRLRVFFLALLGYGYVLGILAATLALVVLVLLYGRFNGVIVKLEIVLVVFAALILRALWVRLPPPQGLPIERRDAGALFAELDRLRRARRSRRSSLHGDRHATRRRLQPRRLTDARRLLETSGRSGPLPRSPGEGGAGNALFAAGAARARSLPAHGSPRRAWPAGRGRRRSRRSSGRCPG